MAKQQPLNRPPQQNHVAIYGGIEAGVSPLANDKRTIVGSSWPAPER